MRGTKSEGATANYQGAGERTGKLRLSRGGNPHGADAIRMDKNGLAEGGRTALNGEVTLPSVYILAESEYGPCKIGFTTKPPKQRFASLQTGNPRKFHDAMFLPVANARAVEAEVHRRLSAARLMGEWFSVTFKAAEAALYEVCPETTWAQPAIWAIPKPQQPPLVAKASGAKFDRKAWKRNYQREYMRKLRAAKKAAPNG